MFAFYSEQSMLGIKQILKRSWFIRAFITNKMIGFLILLLFFLGTIRFLCLHTFAPLLLQDLPLYKDRLEVTFYAGLCKKTRVRVCVYGNFSRFPPPGHYSTGRDRKIALLEDVFRKFPLVPVSIEIKESNMQLIEKVQ